MKSVEKGVEAMKHSVKQIDVLVNNAGIFNAPTDEPKTTQEGWEIHWGVNHLGPYFFTEALLPLIKATPNSRYISII